MLDDKKSCVPSPGFKQCPSSTGLACPSGTTTSPQPTATICPTSAANACVVLCNTVRRRLRHEPDVAGTRLYVVGQVLRHVRRSYRQHVHHRARYHGLQVRQGQPLHAGDGLDLARDDGVLGIRLLGRLQHGRLGVLRRYGDQDGLRSVYRDARGQQAQRDVRTNSDLSIRAPSLRPPLS